jgi:hypothetical protein
VDPQITSIAKEDFVIFTTVIAQKIWQRPWCIYIQGEMGGLNFQSFGATNRLEVHFHKGETNGKIRG